MPSTVNRPPAELAPELPATPIPPATETETQPVVPVVPSVEEPAPAMEHEVTPPADPEDNLFGDPAAPAEGTTPDEEPADDLFGAPAEEAAAPTEESMAPAEQPSTPAESDELFGPTDTPATESTPESPAEEPAGEPTGDDLFGPPADEETPPAEEATPDEEKSEEDDNLFGDSGAILQMPGGLASNELRTWVDNTGQYTCRGRLVRMLDGKVQLLKASGRTTTVPLGRLSQTDLQFVNRQASAQRAEAVGKTARLTPSWSN
jgi:hypothetical protein